MKFIRGVIGFIGLLSVAGAAQAQFSSTWTVASEYDFRGFSQSAKDPALQGSVDYAFPAGFAIGAWASNVDFDNDADIELDLYGSYTGEISENLAWSAGFTYYMYPSSDDVGDYPEIFVGLNAGMFSFKQWYSDNFYDLDVDAWYTEGNATIPLPNDFSLSLHAGYSWGDYWEEGGGGGGELFDFAVGVGYTYQKFNFAVKFTGTDASGGQKIRGDVLNNEPRLYVTVGTTFPWGAE
jgi:uncharacterized protein (TIGR02001 family)